MHLKDFLQKKCIGKYITLRTHKRWFYYIRAMGRFQTSFEDKKYIGKNQKVWNKFFLLLHLLLLWSPSLFFKSFGCHGWCLSYLLVILDNFLSYMVPVARSDPWPDSELIGYRLCNFHSVWYGNLTSIVDVRTHTPSLFHNSCDNIPCSKLAQWAVGVEYTDCFSAEG